MSEQDPWSALQGADVAATDAPPEGVRVAYANDDIVGFDPRLVLPDVCVTCAAEDVQDRRELRLRVSRIPIGPTSQRSIQLPQCDECRHASRRLDWLNWLVSIILPVGLIGLLVVWSQADPKRVHDTLVGWISMAYLAGWAAAWFYRLRLRAAVELDVLRMDEDGFVKLKGVHPYAAEAIVRQAGMD